MKSIVLVLFFTLMSCRDNRRAVIAIPNESARVQSVVLDSLAAGRRLQMLFVCDSTIPNDKVMYLRDVYTRYPVPDVGDSAYALVHGMVPGLLDITSTPMLVDIRAIHLRCSAKAISSAEADKIADPLLTLGAGIASVSQVVFTADSLCALMYVEGIYGSLDGRGGFVLLKKNHSQWLYFGYYSVWVS
jgi:hypothetical protein